MRSLFLFFASTAALPVLGIAVTLWRVDDGIDRFRHDPLAHTVARDAYVTAQVQRDNIFQRVLSPVARVVAVTRRAGHCLDPVSELPQTQASNRAGLPALAKGPERPDETVLREYTAHVRFYTFFAYPAGDVYLTCGGNGASSVKHPNWN